MAITLRLLESIDEIPRGAWDALVAEDASPFVEWTWLACLEESGCVGGDSGWLPRHFTLFEEGVLVAAAPAYVKLHSEGEFVFDWSWADVASRMGLDYFPKLVFAIPFTPAAGARVLVLDPARRAELTELVAGAARALCPELGLSSAHALFPREAEACAWMNAGYMHRLGVQFHWKNEDFGTFEDFLATLPGKRRTQIRRERAQIARDGLTLETLAPGALTPELARTMHRLYLTTVDKFVHGRRYLNARFFELVAERFAHRLAWAVARKDGQIVASAFNVKKGGVLYGRYWGTFVDLPFLHFNVCFYHGIDEAIREGLHTFEPGAGGEHKRVRGFAPTVTHSVHHVEDPRLASLVRPYLERERAAILRHVDEERG